MFHQNETLLFPIEQTQSIMRKVCQWQLANLPEYIVLRPDTGRIPIPNTDWIRASLFVGIMAAWKATQEADYFNAALQWAEGNQWAPGPQPRFADDHCVGQTYLELYLVLKDPKMIAPIQTTFDRILAEPQPGRVDWWWCDALFMAPPVLTLLSVATQQSKYLEFMNQMWWDATEFLYDPEECLYFRDGTFKIHADGSGPREKGGQKIFWGRGNGWVMAALARILPYMPEDYSDRNKYLLLFQEMAQAILPYQSLETGLWPPSLLAPNAYPTPDTSGSGFFCYGLAWGINQGILEKQQYLPVVEKAWSGLLDAVEATGKLGWVQIPGDRPQRVKQEDSVDYGVGAFLLAGSEMIKLTQ